MYSSEQSRKHGLQSEWTSVCLNTCLNACNGDMQKSTRAHETQTSLPLGSVVILKTLSLASHSPKLRLLRYELRVTPSDVYACTEHTDTKKFTVTQYGHITRTHTHTHTNTHQYTCTHIHTQDLRPEAGICPHTSRWSECRPWISASEEKEE